MKTRIYTKQEIVNSIESLQMESDMLANDIPEEMRKRLLDKAYIRIQARITELTNYSDEELIKEFHKQNRNQQLKVFAPGYYFITDDINKFSCQIL
jgi:hypothetical protein